MKTNNKIFEARSNVTVGMTSTVCFGFLTSLLAALFSLTSCNAGEESKSSPKQDRSTHESKNGVDNLISMDRFCAEDQRDPLCQALERKIGVKNKGASLGLNSEGSGPCQSERTALNQALEALNACYRNHPGESMIFIDDSPRVE